MSNRKLPSTSAWKPRRLPGGPLESALVRRCQFVERMLQAAVQYERSSREYAFGSGLPVEATLRRELAALLPDRYSVIATTIADTSGNSAGDCDCVIFNRTWFPQLKAPVGDEPRHSIVPVEGVYAVIEVKETLTERAFDEAMKKQAICQRLNRSFVPKDRIVENTQTGACLHAIRNPLFTAIPSPQLGEGWTLENVAERLFEYGQDLKRQEIVRLVCVLGEGAISWAWRDENDEARPALFQFEDLYLPIFPVIQRDGGHSSALYSFLTRLSTHLYHTVLGAEDLFAFYDSAA